MYTALLLTVFWSASGVLSSSVITPCKLTDQSCLDKMANDVKPIIIAGIPELGIDGSDPLFIKKMEGDLATFKYEIFNTTVVGYSDCEISNLKVNEDMTQVQCDAFCPKVILSGQYDMDGEVLLLPLKGNGDFKIITGKYLIHIQAKMKKVEANDGKSHVAIENFKLKCDPQTAIKIDFKNLFNGQKDLSDAFHKFAEENWRALAEVLQDSLWNGCLKHFFKKVNKYLKSVPVEDFILN